MNDKLVERVARAIAETGVTGELTGSPVSLRDCLTAVSQYQGIEWNEQSFQHQVRQIAKAAIEAAGVVELAEHLRFALNALQTEGVCGDECLTCPEARTAIAKALGDE